MELLTDCAKSNLYKVIRIHYPPPIQIIDVSDAKVLEMIANSKNLYVDAIIKNNFSDYSNIVLFLEIFPYGVWIEEKGVSFEITRMR